MPVTLPKPLPGEIWEVLLQNGVRVRGPITIDDNEDNPRDWHAAVISSHGDRFEFDPFPGNVDLTKRSYQPHPEGWGWNPTTGWRPAVGDKKWKARMAVAEPPKVVVDSGVVPDHFEMPSSDKAVKTVSKGDGLPQTAGRQR